MPQLLLLAAVGVGAYLGARWLRDKADAIQRQQARRAAMKRPGDPAKQAGQPGRDAPTLVQDPETGVYRVNED